MLRCRTILVLAVVAVVVTGARAVDFTLYQRDIIDRKPFGEPPPPPPKPVPRPTPPKPAPPSIFRDLVLVAITDDEGQGIRVGFINKKAKKNYYMAIGDPPEDGISVVAAYPEEGKATLSYDGKQEMMRLPGLAASDAHAIPPEPVAPVEEKAVSPSPSSSSGRIMSYRDRLRQRRREILEARNKAQDDQQKGMSKEDFQKYLEEYQMELIRAQGKKGPPLPIPLTKEMDEALVQEGVLPPQP